MAKKKAPAKASKAKKRPADVNQLAHFLGEQSTQERPPAPASNGSAKVTDADISRVMSILGKKGGRIGGVRRANSLTAGRRKEIALKAARARWDKPTNP